MSPIQPIVRLRVARLLARHRLAGARRGHDEAGQTTAEYALVLLGAASIAVLVMTWANGTDAIGELFDDVVGSVTDRIE